MASVSPAKVYTRARSGPAATLVFILWLFQGPAEASSCDGRPTSRPQYHSKSDPDAECYPFGERKMSGKHGQHFHQKKQQGDGYPECGNDAHPSSVLHDPERDARCEPAQGRRHRAHFGDGNKQCIAQKENRECSCRNSQYSHRRREKLPVHLAETPTNRAPSAVGEKQTCRPNEVAVDTLKKPEHSHD